MSPCAKTLSFFTNHVGTHIMPASGKTLKVEDMSSPLEWYAKLKNAAETGHRSSESGLVAS